MEAAHSLVIMGMDGLVLEDAIKHQGQEKAHQLAIEYCQVLKQTISVGSDSDAGTLRYSLSCFENSIFLVEMITQEYFICLSLSSEANLGKSRYLLEKSLPDLRKHLV